MKSVAVLLCVLATAFSTVTLLDLVREEWSAFKLEHSKQYDSDVEDKLHLKIYIRNKLRIAKHNQRFEQGAVSFKLGLNKYADMLHHDFVATMNGYNQTLKHSKVLNGKGHISRASRFIPPAHVTYPDQVDWREHGAVTEVKDQKRCGSCWAFSTTGSLEGQHFRKTGFLVPLSEQNLVDCSGPYGNQGCKGGLMDRAFTYIKENGGIDTEKWYPYEGIDGKCRYDPEYSGAVDTGFVDISPGDEEELMQAVATVGPVSVAIDASQISFQFYSHGVYYDENCSSMKLNHGVLVVGFGTDKQGGDYWLVKNSWGQSWGDRGYIKMARNRNNHCGIATSASYPLV